MSNRVSTVMLMMVHFLISVKHISIIVTGLQHGATSSDLLAQSEFSSFLQPMSQVSSYC